MFPVLCSCGFFFRDSAISNVATSNTSSDMVGEGGSKDGLSDTEENVSFDFEHSPLLFPK